MTNPYFSLQIKFSHHDGVMTGDGINYLNNSLHLEDVYSVISKDFGGTDGKTDIPYKSLQRPATGPSPLNLHSGPNIKPESRDTLSPVGGQFCEVSMLERATPSPHRDSGIESDVSPSVNTHDNSQQVRYTV